MNNYRDDSPPPPPPPGFEENEDLSDIWERHYSPEDGAFYYFNTQTGDCIWDEETNNQIAAEAEDEVDEDEGEYFMGQEEEEEEDYSNLDHEINNQEYENENEREHYNHEQNEYQSESQNQYYDPYSNQYFENEDDGLDLQSLAEFDIDLDNKSISSSYSTMSSVVERSAFMLQNKEQKIMSLKQQQLQRELSSIKNPTLTNKSRNIQRSVDDMLNWEKERQQRLEQKKLMYDTQKDNEMTGQPTISKYAQRKSNMTTEIDDSGSISTTSSNRSNIPVQDRLHEFELKKRLKIQQMQAEQIRLAKQQSIPKIAPHSSRLVRKSVSFSLGNNDSPTHSTSGNSTSNRLFALAQLRKQTQDFYDCQESMNRKILKDPTTGQRLFEPKLNQTSKEIAQRIRVRGNVPIEEILHAKGKLYERKVQNKAYQKILQEKSMREAPKLNPMSEFLVREKEMNTGETVEDRLHKPIGAVRKSTLENIVQPTFNPTISAGSKEIVAQKGNYIPSNMRNKKDYEEFKKKEEEFNRLYSDLYESGDGNSFEAVCLDDFKPKGKSNNSSTTPSADQSMYERSLHWQNSRTKRLEMEKQRIDKQKMKECSFKPLISGPPSHGNDGSSGLVQSSADDLVNRHLEWMKKREDRLQSQRILKKDSELKECTFTPKVPTASQKILQVQTTPPPPPPPSANINISPNISPNKNSTDVLYKPPANNNTMKAQTNTSQQGPMNNEDPTVRYSINKVQVKFRSFSQPSNNYNNNNNNNNDQERERNNFTSQYQQEPQAYSPQQTFPTQQQQQSYPTNQQYQSYQQQSYPTNQQYQSYQQPNKIPLPYSSQHSYQQQQQQQNSSIRINQPMNSNKNINNLPQQFMALQDPDEHNGPQSLSMVSSMTSSSNRQTNDHHSTSNQNLFRTQSSSSVHFQPPNTMYQSNKPHINNLSSISIENLALLSLDDDLSQAVEFDH